MKEEIQSVKVRLSGQGLQRLIKELMYLGFDRLRKGMVRVMEGSRPRVKALRLGDVAGVYHCYRVLKMGTIRWKEREI